jgi:hypothetical protein
LVEMGQRKGYAKLHRTKRDAAFQQRIAGVPARNLSFARVGSRSVATGCRSFLPR